MRRFPFYLLMFFVTFGISSYILFTLYSENKNNSENASQKPIQKISIYAQETPEYTQESIDYPQEKTEKKKPFCRNKEILPIWKLIIEDRYFLEQSSGLFEGPDCSDMFEILKFDLNQDGEKEILLRGNSADLCGAVGNCGFWIFGKKGKNYRKLLSASDYFEVNEMGDQVKTQMTSGYRDILLKAHWNSSDTVHRTYKFNGQKYIESKCLVDYYIRGTEPSPKWKFISCREHEKLQKY